MHHLWMDILCITSEWVKSSVIDRCRFPSPACMCCSSSADEGVISTFLFKRNAENTNGFQAFMNLAGLLQLGKRLLDPRLKNPGKDLQEMIKSKVSNSKYVQ